MGSAKAAVLPVPVCAVPIKSFLARIIGNARSWIGVGSANPIACVPRTTSGESSKSLNDTIGKLGGFQSSTTERADHTRQWARNYGGSCACAICLQGSHSKVLALTAFLTRDEDDGPALHVR